MTTVDYTHDVNGSLQKAQGSDNRLNTSARTDSRSYYNSRDKQEAYSLVWSDADSATGDLVLYWKNSDTQGRHLVIDSVGMNADGDTEFQLLEVTGVAAGVTATPTCLNRAAPRVAPATCIEAAGTPISGLTDGVIIDHVGVVAGGHEEFRLDDRLRVPEGKAIAVKCKLTASNTKTWGVIFGYYE